MSSSTIQLVARYWDKNVANWKVAKDLTVGSREFFKEVERYRFEKLDYLPRLVDYAGYAGQQVLDLGCGLATDSSRFAAGKANVTGIDISPTAIDLARKNFAQRQLDGDFSAMNGESLEFADASFDFVYCHTVLHFTPNPAAMIGEIQRVLKPGGTAFLMTINRNSWLYILHRIARLRIDYLDAPIFHRFNYQEFEFLLQSFHSYKIIVERFPVKTEVHKGIKAFLYNNCFVAAYNALPKAIIGKSGYHLLAWVTKSS